MSISGNLRVSVTLGSHTPQSFQSSLPFTKLLIWLFEFRESVGNGLKKFGLWAEKIEKTRKFSFIIPRFLRSQMEHLGTEMGMTLKRHRLVDFTGFRYGGSSIPKITPKWSSMQLHSRDLRAHSQRTSGIIGNVPFSPKSLTEEAESFLLNAINMSFLERLNLAWKIMFPSQTSRRSSNACIAKQRLKMILFSDRCAVSDEAKQKIVGNIVSALSDFVEIEAQDKVQLNVSTDTDLGTIYSVTVPVRRVKPEYQDAEEIGVITNVEYKDTGERSGSVDVKFDFYIPDERTSGF